MWSRTTRPRWDRREPVCSLLNTPASVTIAAVANYIGAIDQGTTSTRFCVFDAAGKIVASAQKEHEQIYPQPGWVEHNPDEIWQSTQDVIAQALETGKLQATDLAAIGITNQRETTVLWNRENRQARGQRPGLAGHTGG
jgi:glycerol kinase